MARKEIGSILSPNLSFFSIEDLPPPLDTVAALFQSFVNHVYAKEIGRLFETTRNEGGVKKASDRRG